MSRYCFYIDGFNVYYALEGNPAYHKYKWLNYRKLAESVAGAKDTITGIFYFTTMVRWHPDGVKRHERYIKVLRSVGVETIHGRFLEKTIKCHKCQQYFKTHEEKQTDVNIALKIVGDAIDNVYDKALIISADSDLLPVIKSVQHHAPEKETGVMFPIGRTSFELRQNAGFRRKMSEQLLLACQFPDAVKIGDSIITRPENWR
ncbi:MAG: NYN domain-containing protein [Sedimentisphaerales bacterium]|nr:NYN domain-containing protein [Sedimentisphaerales bacterium]